ncbi:MAG: hypothetical protein AMXMBFR64_04850 [Myxococcales bacterium]
MPISPRVCPSCSAAVVELVYRCGARTVQDTQQQHIRTTPCGAEAQTKAGQMALPLQQMTRQEQAEEAGRRG